MLNAGKPEGQPTREPFYWALEFPEVFLEEDEPKGFSAIVGNPPFMGGSKITGTSGTDYREFLVEYVARSIKGNADLCDFFFLNAGNLLASKGTFGLVATNTIAQGDTLEVGLDQLIRAGFSIPRAVSTLPWPGTASLEFSYVWLQQALWKGKFILDGKIVSGITSFLKPPGTVSGNPYRLANNRSKSFLGSKVYGQGFVLEVEESKQLINKNHKNEDVLFPYINGQDLNSNPDQSPS
jgi:hypothetical protein